MKRLAVGILANVDAGKTTLSEGMLYLAGNIRKIGRVDHKDAFLDNYDMERERGITIFSKQAVLNWNEVEMTLLDTPGHVDFSAEMERTLQVLDYAVLVISGTDGVTGHTQTLWNLLKKYNIPAFIFVNKMDITDASSEEILEQLQSDLHGEFVDFKAASDGKFDDSFYENIAVADEKLLDAYMEYGRIEKDSIKEAIQARKIFPCFFGSALKLDGVEELMKGFSAYTKVPVYPKEFGAKVFKIARDEQGKRLTYLKITGGTLKVKELLESEQEKIEQIRIYSGAKYKTADLAEAGMICAVTGLTKTSPGQGLGIESSLNMSVIEPVMTYQVIPEEGTDVHTLLNDLKQIEEEEPQLHIVWNEKLQEIHAQLMGEVQLEVLKRLVWDRFKIEIQFGSGSIVYKETIKAPVEGVGHFEPLRHYAEVHLLLEPLEAGSGLIFTTDCKEDELDKNWQRLILTHLEEREHLGVLTGSAITDMKITLIAGRAHLKHTEGGDFRQATYRAVRQGLMQAESVLLEPYYQFKMELPHDNVGRAMNDIQRMNGNFEGPVIEGDMSVLTGEAPVSQMNGYVIEFNSYTGGMGRFSCSLGSYKPCHNQEEIVESYGYDAEADLDNPAGSVFCAHGAGFYVPWYEVPDYMHLEGRIIKKIDTDEEETVQGHTAKVMGGAFAGSYSGTVEEDAELEAIFERTFGAVKNRLNSTTNGNLGYESRKKWKKKENIDAAREEYRRIHPRNESDKKEYLLVDGYNIIFSWDELKKLSETSLEAARTTLMDMMCNYQGFVQCTLILVFDAYKVKGNPGEAIKYHNINVVYTKEAETADMYIEKVTHEIGKKHNVTVATSDGLEQLIVIGQGAKRMSAREFHGEVERVYQRIREIIQE